ncbi:Na(+)/H(+) antiporter [Saccharomyces cerevisiae S288c] [Rhizoctonia solani]|uniref:Na(+)/H(+) antiporter [Saccharomyces cerevisiae S288c] n=1 Tax=Rhizoctonia solani TaxID=456999 RepID=A0A0K6FPG4_9AGAM|nr:Na(+)/H(+) antiporter [Saccharomyces cerevisiae S288c] [Rhizoctonia solani]
MDFEVSKVNLAYSVLGGFVVCFSLVSLFLRNKIFMSEAPFALVFGLVIGPYGLGVFDPRSWAASEDPALSVNYLTFELTRLALGFGLFAIGVELPKTYLRDHARSLTALVVPVMAWGWFISAGLISWIFPALSFTSALVLANAIVSGRWAEQNVPENLRLLLAAESAANDGLAYPFLYISLKVLSNGTEPLGIVRFIWESVVYQVLLGVFLGAFLGWMFRLLLQQAESKNLIDRSSYIGQYLSLTLLSLGATALVGGDDLLAAFAAGSAVSWDGHFNEKSHESEFSSIIEVFFNCACFVYIGAWLPFDTLSREVDPHLGITSDKMFLLFVAILILRRIPPLVALWWTGWLMPDVKTLGEALFSGHFGPMGVGAIFISMLALTELSPSGQAENQIDRVTASIQPIVSFIVLGSIFIHGISIPFFSLSTWLHTTYIKARRNAARAKHSIGSISPFRRSRVLPDEQQALLSDEPNPGRYAVGTRDFFDATSEIHTIEWEEQA